MLARLGEKLKRVDRKWLIGALVAAHVGLFLHCAQNDFVTVDEIGNLAAGLAYWENGAYGLYNVNPPLTKQLATLPVYLAGSDTSAIAFSDVPGQRREWDIGDRYARANADRYLDLVFLARLPGLAWSLFGAWLVYRWTKELWGSSAGLLSLAVWCFEPNILAHGHLITADLPAAVMALAAAYTLRNYLISPTGDRALIAGLCLGVAELTKFTLVVFYPIWLLIWSIAFAVQLRRPEIRPRLWHLGLSALTCLFVINLDYEFSGTGARLGDLPFVSKTLSSSGDELQSQGVQVGNRFQNSWLGSVRIPVPEPMIRGVDVQRRDFELYKARPKYLRGEWRVEGWWHYYLYAALVKLPVGVWLLALLSIALILFRGPQAGWREILCLALPALGLVALAVSQRSLQSHFRYVLPAFPFIVVWLGRSAADWEIACAARRVFVVGSMLLAAGSYLSVHPHAIAYFNEPAGGPDNGHRHLLGSNIDWGQDLLRLKAWLAQHPEIRGIKFAYFNHVDPRIVGIEFEPPPQAWRGPAQVGPPREPIAAARFGPTAGCFAVSVRLVMGNQVSIPDGQGGYRFAPPMAYAYFQRFQPVAKAGHSIFIYRISVIEADSVRQEMGLPPLP